MLGTFRMTVAGCVRTGCASWLLFPSFLHSPFPRHLIFFVCFPWSHGGSNGRTDWHVWGHLTAQRPWAVPANPQYFLIEIPVPGIRPVFPICQTQSYRAKPQTSSLVIGTGATIQTTTHLANPHTVSLTRCPTTQLQRSFFSESRDSPWKLDQWASPAIENLPLPWHYISSVLTIHVSMTSIKTLFLYIAFIVFYYIRNGGIF